MLRTIALHAVIVLTVAAATVAACGTDSEQDGQPTTEPTTPPVPTATAVPTTEPESRPTGIESVDEAIAAVESGDVDAFIELVLLKPEACAPPAMGAGGPPQCESGEVAGTRVDVAPLASCEGYWSRESELRQSLIPLFEGEPALFGVYRANERLFERSGSYAVIFEVNGPNGRLARDVVMNDEGVVGVNLGCGQTPEQMVDLHVLTDVIFLPDGNGGEEPSVRCVEGASAALCDLARSLAVAAQEKNMDALTSLVDRGEPERVQCEGDGEPFEAEMLCAGAAAGEVREGFHQAVHGSEGTVISPTSMKTTIANFAAAGMRIASTGCTAGCQQFIVAFETGSGSEPRAVYVAFEVMAAGATFVGAGVSGDNADTILDGGVTYTVAGEATFAAWHA